MTDSERADGAAPATDRLSDDAAPTGSLDGGAASLAADGGAAPLDGGAAPLDGGAASLDGGAASLDGRDDEVARLVGLALDGDHEAWSRLVERFAGRIWAVCRIHGLGPADAADVFQQTWLRALENLGSLRSPERLGAWLGTTARNEARAALRRARRTQPVDDGRLLDREAGPDGDPERPLLLADRDAELWAAFARLGRRCRDVLRVLVVDAGERRPSYEMAAAALDIPIGSLGPTRRRCLTQLRRFLTEGIGDGVRHS